MHNARPKRRRTTTDGAEVARGSSREDRGYGTGDDAVFTGVGQTISNASGS